MSSARGLANHSLYMARIVLAGWQASRDSSDIMSEAADAAFAPAVRLHLLDAYGWFLLAMLRATDLPERPPHTTDELPERGRGIAVPGELLEYQGLERQGSWLSRLQATLPRGLPRPAGRQVLAMAGSYPNINDYHGWAAALAELFERMSDSLDEY